MTGSADQMVKVWLYEQGVPTYVGTGHAGVVTNVKVSPDGQSLVSTSADGGIFLWRFPHVADVPAPSSAGDSAECNLREQQTDRSRRLSLKKTLPERVENISTISMSQKAQVVENGSRVVTTSDNGRNVDSKDVDAVSGGSVKCLCRCGTKCVCCD